MPKGKKGSLVGRVYREPASGGSWKIVAVRGGKAIMVEGGSQVRAVPVRGMGGLVREPESEYEGNVPAEDPPEIARDQKSLYDQWRDGGIEFELWEERDRLHIGLRDKATGESIADWWDDDARQMFDDGFFKQGPGLEESVVRYADEMDLGKRKAPAEWQYNPDTMPGEPEEELVAGGVGVAMIYEEPQPETLVNPKKPIRAWVRGAEIGQFSTRKRAKRAAEEALGYDVVDVRGYDRERNGRREGVRPHRRRQLVRKGGGD